MGNFSVSLEKFAELSVCRADAAIKKTALTITRRIIMRTPVLTGRLRGNWLASINSPHPATVDREDKSGTIAMAETTEVIRDWDTLQESSFFLCNNLPYAQRIEDGYSKEKAPRGMVGITLTEFDAIVQGNLK